jgi:hypothetical protein
MYKYKENNKMNQKSIFKTTAIFVALSITGICLLVFGGVSAVEILRSTLPPLGSAIFASGLTFFLLEVSRKTNG